MPKAREKKRAKRRTQIKDLPRKEKELTKEERKQVKGGLVITFPESHAKLKN